LIRAQKETVGLNKGAAAGGKKESPRGAFTEPRDERATLAEAGIDKKLSSRAQKLAAMPPPRMNMGVVEAAMVEAVRKLRTPTGSSLGIGSFPTIKGGTNGDTL
jgi:hypothetical protein